MQACTSGTSMILVRRCFTPSMSRQTHSTERAARWKCSTQPPTAHFTMLTANGKHSTPSCRKVSMTSAARSLHSTQPRLRSSMIRPADWMPSTPSTARQEGSMTPPSIQTPWELTMTSRHSWRCSIPFRVEISMMSTADWKHSTKWCHPFGTGWVCLGGSGTTTRSLSRHSTRSPMTYSMTTRPRSRPSIPCLAWPSTTRLGTSNSSILWKSRYIPSTI
mmetsp:Transcript_19962/g.63518  ORF Transcript_19962/g.63518 Transcript_19962/m.63518 type:complete len:219 (-) Transcript_19962:1722-2378(-)